MRILTPVNPVDELIVKYGPTIEDFLNLHGAGLIQFRRFLHTRPELSGQEYLTTAGVVDRLDQAGLVARRLDVGTGLTCDVGTNPGPLVALRADLDALAMQDRGTAEYRSQIEGAAHACGHDVHTTIVLGAGLLLQELLVDQPGGVRLIFEPSEEQVPGGAVDVIAEGRLVGVESVFALHCDPKLDVGLVGTRVGPITSAADLVEITLAGPGGHTARPHLTVDLLAAAGRFLVALPEEVAKRAADIGPLSLVFGAIHGGNASNVIPAEVVLRGSLRTPDPTTWKEAAEILDAAVRELAATTGATATIMYRRGVPPVNNDAATTALLEQAAHGVLGADCLRNAEHSLGGDSFAWYADHAPIAYARLGVHDPRAGTARKDLHSADFDVDERSIDIGIRLLALTALNALQTLSQRTMSQRGGQE